MMDMKLQKIKSTENQWALGLAGGMIVAIVGATVGVPLLQGAGHWSDWTVSSSVAFMISAPLTMLIADKLGGNNGMESIGEVNLEGTAMARELNDITTEEAAWLLKATINTAQSLGQEVDLDSLNADFVSKGISRYRSTNRIYGAVSAIVKSGGSVSQCPYGDQECRNPSDKLGFDSACQKCADDEHIEASYEPKY